MEVTDPDQLPLFPLPTREELGARSKAKWTPSPLRVPSRVRLLSGEVGQVTRRAVFDGRYEYRVQVGGRVEWVKAADLEPAPEVAA